MGVSPGQPAKGNDDGRHSRITENGCGVGTAPGRCMMKRLIRLIPITVEYLAATARRADVPIHAVEFSFNGPYVPVCGADVPRIKLYGVRCQTSEGPGIQAMEWPPPARGFGERCRECWVATGKKRPGPSWRAVVDAEAAS